MSNVIKCRVIKPVAGLIAPNEKVILVSYETEEPFFKPVTIHSLDNTDDVLEYEVNTFNNNYINVKSKLVRKFYLIGEDGRRIDECQLKVKLGFFKIGNHLRKI